MKKYILYILTGVAACGLCSCEDALDRYPKDRLTPDNFFHTEEECQLYTNDFYTMFPSAGTIYGETADIIAKTTLTSEVLGNRTVPATAGSWKWEKLRDILTLYDDIPRIVVSAGCDPLTDDCKAYADALREAGVAITMEGKH
jgi:acetyl esterase/lipase